jgi:DNA-directed RNA polymerase sigma subunit (sigma70/sigma32)
LKEYLFEKMKQLKPRQRDIVYYKFFNNKEMTLDVVGVKFGLTREAVRLNIMQSIHKLRKLVEKDNVKKEDKTKTQKGKNNEKEIQLV